MSSSIKEKIVAGTVTSATQDTSHDEYSNCERTRMLLSVVHALKEATYLICGLLALLMAYSWACESDLADQEFNRSHKTTLAIRNKWWKE